MLDQLQRQGPALSWKTGNDTMEGNGSDPHQDKARRFRDAALPYLDDVYTLARYLLRDTGDAEDAVQECYLRALRNFDGFRGLAMKPWLLAILRNVCYAQLARRSRREAPADLADWERWLEEEPAHSGDVRQALTRWRDDPELASLRKAGELERLTEDERKECLAVWSAVDDLLARAGN